MHLLHRFLLEAVLLTECNHGPQRLVSFSILTALVLTIEIVKVVDHKVDVLEAVALF